MENDFLTTTSKQHTMSKTAETVLAEITEQDVKEFSPSIIRKDKAFYVREDSVIQAMHTYAEQMVQGFIEWANKNGFVLYGTVWRGEGDVEYTNQQLYSTFLTQQNQK